MLCLCAEKAGEENRELSVSDEEMEEDVFRKRKVELTSAGTGALKKSFTVFKLGKSNFLRNFLPAHLQRR